MLRVFIPRFLAKISFCRLSRHHAAKCQPFFQHLLVSWCVGLPILLHGMQESWHVGCLQTQTPRPILAQPQRLQASKASAACCIPWTQAGGPQDMRIADVLGEECRCEHVSSSSNIHASWSRRAQSSDCSLAAGSVLVLMLQGGQHLHVICMWRFLERETQMGECSLLT